MNVNEAHFMIGGVPENYFVVGQLLVGSHENFSVWDMWNILQLEVNEFLLPSLKSEPNSAIFG